MWIDRFFNSEAKSAKPAVTERRLLHQVLPDHAQDISPAEGQLIRYAYCPAELTAPRPI